MLTRIFYSSPESSSRNQYQTSSYQDRIADEDYGSDTELNQRRLRSTPQPRSATIGADTPPSISNSLSSGSVNVVNRSETIGATLNTDNLRPASYSSENRMGAIGLDTTTERDANLTGGNSSDQGKPESRRESIEGQPQDNELSNLVSSIRDLTVGENPRDGAISNSSALDGSKKLSRHESSDSDHKHRGKSPRDKRDRRYKERDERERNKVRSRDRYSPDSYRDKDVYRDKEYRDTEHRDKRYDRRKYRERHYDDDTDYYSDKERRHLEDRDRREVYERKYSSLKREKDKEKRRKDGREYGRDPRRGEYYYNRYEDNYDEVPRSRPTSRTDSMHDSYREKDRERDRRHRDRDRERRHRDPFNSYMQVSN